MQQLLHYSFGNNTFMYCSVYFFYFLYGISPSKGFNNSFYTSRMLSLCSQKLTFLVPFIWLYLVFFFLDLNKMSNLPPATSLLITLPIHCILNSVLPMNSVLIAVPNQNSQSYYQVFFKTTYAEIEASLKNWAEMLQCSPPLLWHSVGMLLVLTQ